MTDCKHGRRLKVPHLPPLTFRGDSISAGRGEITWRLQCADCGAPMKADGTADVGAQIDAAVAEAREGRAERAGGYLTPRTEGQFRFDALGQRTCLKCGAGICAGCTPEKCGSPCDACIGATSPADDAQAAIEKLQDRVRELMAERDALQVRVRALEAALEALLAEADVGARGNHEDFAKAEALALAALRKP